jgi:hypothetical protein
MRHGEDGHGAPLRRFLEQRPELRAAVLAHAKQDIARKLMGAMAR